MPSGNSKTVTLEKPGLFCKSVFERCGNCHAVGERSWQFPQRTGRNSRTQGEYFSIFLRYLT